MAEEDGEWVEAWRGTGTVARVGDLAAGRQYSFRVAASSAVGEGQFSRPTAARTLLQPPQPPRNLHLQPTLECATCLCSAALRALSCWRIMRSAYTARSALMSATQISGKQTETQYLHFCRHTRSA